MKWLLESPKGRAYIGFLLNLFTSLVAGWAVFETTKKGNLDLSNVYSNFSFWALIGTILFGLAYHYFLYSAEVNDSQKYEDPAFCRAELNKAFVQQVKKKLKVCSSDRDLTGVFRDSSQAINDLNQVTK